MLASLSSVVVSGRVPRKCRASRREHLSPGNRQGRVRPSSVTVGSERLLHPACPVNILECADPGGLGRRTFPRTSPPATGTRFRGLRSWSVPTGASPNPTITVYLLPSQALGEQSNYQPVCNQTNHCVLYVGQNQNDFTAPKVFSAPFLVSPARVEAAPPRRCRGSSRPRPPGGCTSTAHPRRGRRRSRRRRWPTRVARSPLLDRCGGDHSCP